MASKQTKRKMFKHKSTFTDEQKLEIRDKFNNKYSVEDIAEDLDIPSRLVREYVDQNLFTFNGKEGRKCLEIIRDNCGKSAPSELREKIVTKNFNLQEQICQLPEEELGCIKKYFLKFEESKSFFEIDETLSIEAKESIRVSGIGDLENLSVQLKRTTRVIKKYLLQYFPDESLKLYYDQEQLRKIRNLAHTFRLYELISHTKYRMVISESFDDLIKNSRKHKKEPNTLLTKLLPLAFYDLKCSLQLEEISKIINEITNIPLTALDIFHLLLQMSVPMVRGLCIELYSFSNPVPLYHPRIGPYDQGQTSCQFEICKQLWYSVQKFNGLVSIGLGWASWNSVGKSHLLDLMFETDFVKGSPQDSAFHLGSIDIQMTKNLFGDKKDNATEPTNWAYIDCHGYSDINLIAEICQNLDIALIHVTLTDFKNEENYSRLSQDLHRITNNTRHVYVLVRDYSGDSVEEGRPLKIDGKTCNVIFIPNLKKQTNLSAGLKRQGYHILHSETDNLKCVNDLFYENVLKSFNKENDFEEEKQLIEKVLVDIRSDKENKFTCLSYYPHFVEYMRCYYKASNAIDLKVIDEQNRECVNLTKKIRC